MWKKVIKSSYKRRTHVIVRGNPRHGEVKQGDSGEDDEETNENGYKDDISDRDDECSNSNEEHDFQASSVSDAPRKAKKPGSAAHGLRRSKSMVNISRQSMVIMSRRNSIIEVERFYILSSL